MPDTSEDIVKTESKVKPRNKKGFREPTSLHVDPKLWQEVRIMSVLKNVSVTEYFERALRKQIDEDNREAGRQGYQVGHGGMYIPPPPVAPASLQTQQEPVFKPKSEDSLIKTKGKSYPDYDKIPYVDEHLQLVLSEEDAKKMTKQQKQILRFLGTLGNVRINLPGIKFPTNKNTIIEHAEKANTQAIVNLLKNLPNKMYDSDKDFGSSLHNVIRGKNGIVVSMFLKEFGREVTFRRGIAPIINTEDIRKVEQKQLIQQQEQELSRQTK